MDPKREEWRNIRRQVERQLSLGERITNSANRLPAPGQVPKCEAMSTGVPMYHVTVYIDVVNPANGSTRRIPVYIDTPTRDNAEELIATAIEKIKTTNSLKDNYNISRNPQPLEATATIGSVCYG